MPALNHSFWIVFWAICIASLPTLSATCTAEAPKKSNSNSSAAIDCDGVRKKAATPGNKLTDEEQTKLISCISIGPNTEPNYKVYVPPAIDRSRVQG